MLTHDHTACHLPAETAHWSTITQIYEDTNQIQRMLMAQRFLKGWSHWTYLPIIASTWLRLSEA